MRRLLCLLPLLLGLLAPAAFGQFRIGAVGGVNASDFDGAAGAELDAAAGFHAGVIVDVGSAPIALRLGLAYVSAGEIIPTPISAPLVPDPRQPDVSVVLGDTLASGYDLTYLAIPIELHYRVERPGAIPYVSVGPELRLPLGDQGPDVEDAALSTTVAFNVTGGVLFDLPSGLGLFAEIRYSADVSGFTDGTQVDPDGDVGPFPTVNIASYQVNLFSIRAGFLF